MGQNDTDEWLSDFYTEKIIKEGEDQFIIFLIKSIQKKQAIHTSSLCSYPELMIIFYNTCILSCGRHCVSRGAGVIGSCETSCRYWSGLYRSARSTSALFAISLALHACFPKNSFCFFGASNANSWEIHNHNNKTQAVVQGIFLIHYFDCSLFQCPKELILAKTPRTSPLVRTWS